MFQSFNSLLIDPNIQIVDLFSFNKANFSLGYAFLPVVIMNKVLFKIIQVVARVFLVNPNWPQSGWFFQIIHLFVEVSLQLSLWPHLLSHFRICHNLLAGFETSCIIIQWSAL